MRTRELTTELSSSDNTPSQVPESATMDCSCGSANPPLIRPARAELAELQCRFPDGIDARPLVFASSDGHCGTSHELSIDELLACGPWSNATYRPLPETSEEKTLEILAGFKKPALDVAAPKKPLADALLPTLTEYPQIPPAPISTIVTGTTSGPVVAAIIDYVFTAWKTVQRALNSNWRIRRQWWYFEFTGGGWQTYAPWFWFGAYSDWKLEMLEPPLRLALERMTGGTYNDVQLPTYHIVPGATNCIEDDVRILLSSIRCCPDWYSAYSDHQREVSLMAALMVGYDTKVQNRPDKFPLITGSGTELGYPNDNFLVGNAYNVAEWAKARFQEFGYRHIERVQWDMRRVHSADTMFKPVLTSTGKKGQNNNRPYTTHPASQTNHTQLKRAWDEATCLIESGMRFLYKLSYLNKTAIEDMWNFGFGFDPETEMRFNRGDWLIRRWWRPPSSNQYSVPNSENDIPFGDSDHGPSLRTWFGPFDPAKLLLVYRVILCRALRSEGKYKRGDDELREHFRIYAKKTYSKSINTSGLSHLDGSTDLWAPFFDETDNQRRRTIIHELMHYMIRWDKDGGRPRDHKSSTHCGHKLNICYNQWECRNLADANSSMSRSNINNYLWWLHYRWRRWGSDWPPSCDAGPGETWHNDPIEDYDFHNHVFDRVRDIGWARLDALETKFGLQGYMPWD